MDEPAELLFQMLEEIPVGQQMSTPLGIYGGFTDDVASRLGRHLQRTDSVETLDISIHLLSETGNYEDFLSYLRETTKLRTLSLTNVTTHLAESNVARRILAAASCSYSIIHLTLLKVNLPLASLLQQRLTQQLTISNCYFAGAEDTTGFDCLQTSSQLTLLNIASWNDSDKENFLKIVEVHSHLKSLVISCIDAPVGSIKDLLRLGTRITTLHVDHVASKDMSYLMDVLHMVPPSIRMISVVWDVESEVSSQVADNSPILDTHKREVIRAMNASSTLRSIHATVRIVNANGTLNCQSLFSAEERQTMDSIGTRNRELPVFLQHCGSNDDTVCPLGLWPHVFHCAARSGHPEHIHQIANSIRALCQIHTMGSRTGKTVAADLDARQHNVEEMHT